MIDNIDENVLKNGKDGIKQNMLKVFDEFIDVYADEMWQIVNELIKLKTENAKLRARLEKAVELPFFQKDGEVIVLIYKNKDGIVLIETYIEDEYYNGKRGNEAAEARFKELLVGER